MRNEAEALVYSTDRALGEYRSLLDAEESAMLQHSLASVKTALEVGEIRQLRESVKELAAAGSVLSRLIYRSADAADPFKGDPGQMRAVGDDAATKR